MSFRNTSGRKGWKRRLFAAGLATMLAGAGYLAFPHAQSAYKRAKAESAITAVEKTFSEYKAAVQSADKTIKETSFLFVDEAERSSVLTTLEDARRFEHDIVQRLAQQRQLIALGKTDDVRRNLVEDFDMPKGQLRRTFASEISGARSLLEEKAAYCTARKGTRDAVMRNELYLKTRLNLPLPAGQLERPVKDSIIPDDLYSLIPYESPALLAMPKELRNSLGANLLKHRGAKDHLEACGSNTVMKRAYDLFHAAGDAYMQVMALNDALTWYRPLLDGTFSFDDHKRLLAQQEAPLALISTGDRALEALVAYFREAHEQRIVFVSGHRDEETINSHSKLTYDFFDGEWKIKHYRTEGRKFFYVLTTLTPEGSSEKTFFVGEKDSDDASSWQTWNYRPAERPRFGRE